MLRLVLVMLCFIQAKGTKAPLKVYPRVVEERSSDGRMVLQIDAALTLRLRKASVSAPEFRVLAVEDGEDVTHFYSGEDLDRFLYEDETQLATVHVIETDRGHEIEGVVGPDRRIQPMPAMERSAEGLIPHMIYNIEQKRMLDESLSPSHIDQSIVSERSNGAQQPVPETVIVELFIISDSQHHKHFSQTKHLVTYLAVMVNSVNLRYAAARSPKIKFSLTGIQQNKDETYKSGQGGYMHSSTTLKNLKSYVKTKQSDFGHPDVVYLMTGYDVYDSSTSSLGIGYVGGVCTEFLVALGEDTAGFYNGMHTLTHESAHVLGSEHDESPPTESIKGHPGSMSCLWASGYIMSYVNNGPEHHLFSECSLRQMQHVISIRGEVCWKTTRPGKTRDGQYPGMKVSLQAFCKHIYPDKNNVTVDMDPQHLQKCKVKCQYPVVRYEHMSYGVRTITTIYSKVTDSLDYMHCADGKVCIRGVCVNKPPEKPKKPKLKKTTSQ